MVEAAAAAPYIYYRGLIWLGPANRAGGAPDMDLRKSKTCKKNIFQCHIVKSLIVSIFGFEINITMQPYCGTCSCTWRECA